MPNVPLDATQARASDLVDTERLFALLASYANNPRIRVISLGRSIWGADIPLVAVAEPAVLVDLNGTCREASRYYDPEIVHRTWDASDPSVTNLPLHPDVRLPVLIEGGTFGFEASHTEGLLQAIEYLATQDTEEIRHILSRTIALFIPMANPDGRELAIRQWQAFPLSAGQDGAGNAYGFYLNRDFFHLTQPESRAVLKAVTDYAPLACLDTHEDMFLLGVKDPDHVCFCPPFAKGHNPEVDRDVMTATNRLGSAIARRWQQEGFDPLYSEQGDHSFLAPPRSEDRGKVVSPLAGVDGRLELVLQLYGIPTLITESARTPGTQTWADRNRQKSSASIALLRAVADDPESFVRTTKDARLRAIREGRGRAYAIRVRDQPADALAEAISVLLAHGFQVYRTELPQPTYLVPQAQPSGRAVEMLLCEATSKQAALGPCLGLEVLDLSVLPTQTQEAYRRAPLAPVTFPPVSKVPPSYPGRQRPKSWAIEFSRDGITAVNRILRQKRATVRRIERGPDAGGFAVETTPLNLALATMGLHVRPQEARAAPKGILLRMPLTAVYAGQGVNEGNKPYLAGVRFALDHFEFVYELLEKGDVTAPALKQYDALIVPGGNAREIVEGWDQTSIGHKAPWQSAGSPRGIDRRGLVAIRDYVRRGGTYIGIGSGGGVLAGRGFLEFMRFEVAGSDLGVGRVHIRLEDSTHPLVWGYRGSANAAGRPRRGVIPVLYYSEPFTGVPGGPVFRTGRGVQVVGTYAGADADLEGSKLIRPELLSAQRRYAAIMYRRVGRGHVCVFGIDPTFRGAWWGTARLLANALYIAASR